MNYEDFYRKIWGEYITEMDVSYEYRERNVEFIKQLTFSLFKRFENKNVHESVYAENIKLFFYNLFLYNPETFDC